MGPRTESQTFGTNWLTEAVGYGNYIHIGFRPIKAGAENSWILAVAMAIFCMRANKPVGTLPAWN